MTITNQDIDDAIRTSNTGTAADSPIRALTNALLKALNAELQNTQQDLLNKVDIGVFNALAEVARSGSFTDLSGAPQSYGATGQNTDGFMTQKAATDALAAKADLEGGKVKLEQLPSGLVSGVIFKGLWDADANKDNTNSTLPSTPSNDGDYYIVSVAGTQFGFTFAAGDWLIADNGAWAHLEPDNLVASVNGKTGAVTIDVGVTSIGVNVPQGLEVSGVPITSTGVIEIALASGYVIPTVEQLQAIGGIDVPEGWQEAGNETKYLAGDGTLKNLPSDTQSDWAQANSNAPDFIKNKPQLFNGDYESLTNQPDIPSKTSDLQNDSAFVTSASFQGLVPKPQDWGDGDKYLAGDGTLKTVQGGDGATIKGAWEVDTTEPVGLTPPENAANNAFTLSVDNPVYIPELDKELSSGDIVIFDENGAPTRYIPKEFADDVDLSDYAKKDADEEITGAWQFTSNDPILQSLNAKYEPLTLKLGQIPMASALSTSFGEMGTLIDPNSNAFVLGADRDTTEGDVNLELSAFDTANFGARPLSGVTANAMEDGGALAIMRVYNKDKDIIDNIRLTYSHDTGETEFSVEGLEIKNLGAPTSPTSAARLMDIGAPPSNPSVTGTFSALGATNMITMTGVNLAETLDLEVGDVIKISDSEDGLNDKYHTVEFIGDGETKPVGSITVNYEHCGLRGDGSLKLADETTADVTIERFKKWHEAPLGLGQAWVGVVGFRSGNTVFTADLNRTIGLSVGKTNGTSSGTFKINNIVVYGFTADNRATFVQSVINAGSTYQTETFIPTCWSELR